jgi:hypothetical protein
MGEKKRSQQGKGAGMGLDEGRFETGRGSQPVRDKDFEDEKKVEDPLRIRRPEEKDADEPPPQRGAWRHRVS